MYSFENNENRATVGGKDENKRVLAVKTLTFSKTCTQSVYEWEV